MRIDLEPGSSLSRVMSGGRRGTGLWSLPSLGGDWLTPSFLCGDTVATDQFALRFYSSEAWKKCRSEFKKSKGRLCECCLARGIINAGSKDNPLQVHHKVKLTPENINDPEITLNWDNLELLCQQCHIERHADEDRQSAGRWKIGENGEVIIK